MEIAPDIPRCCLEGQRDYTLIDHAVAYGCSRVQFFKPYIRRGMIDRAHALGLTCNVFWSDDPLEAREFLQSGMDVILTNDCFGLLRERHCPGPRSI